MAASLKVVCALVLCMLVVEPLATTALKCADVATKMKDCINYLRSGGNLPPACCNGVRALNSQAITTPDRQTACNCLQQAAKSMGSSLKSNLAEGLPGKCGVNIPYKISTSTNCNNVK